MSEDKKPITNLEYEFGMLRQAFLELQDKVVSRLMQFDTLKKQIDAKLSQIDPLSSINVKKIAQLKQLGINPKDLLRGVTTLENDKESKKG